MCDICGHIPCVSRCPNYIAPKATHYCHVCHEGILDGEEYIENDNGEYTHIDCFSGINDVVEWLGYDVRIMSE